MRCKYLGIILIGLFTLTFAAPVPAEGRVSDVTQWDFDVYLNDKKVGKHVFKVSEADGIRQVKSDAKFTYTILFIPAYRYEHSAAERWEDECLVEINSRTDANGERVQVAGERTGAGFRLVSGAAASELPECVMTFAYWNPGFLNEPHLLNPQTGELVDVQVERVGNEVLEVRGEPVAATRFRLTAYEVDLTLWYSANDEWLALESVAEGGHIIRYELS